MPEEINASTIRPHFKALESSFKGLGGLFKCLTYEQGRIEAMYEDYPVEAKKLLQEAVDSINSAGEKIRAAAKLTRSTYRGPREQDEI